jgi:hypothetical protein
MEKKVEASFDEEKAAASCRTPKRGKKRRRGKLAATRRGEKEKTAR